MEGSLASIFMEGCLPCLPLSWTTSGENMEELQQQVLYTSMELQSARDAAKAQNKLNEEKICHLQGLLEVMQKERDEARLKCGKLCEFLLHLSRNSSQVLAPTADSPCSFLQSSISSTSCSAQFSQPSPSSPAIDASLSFQEPYKTCTDDCVSFLEHNMDMETFSEKSQAVQDIFVLDAATEEDTQLKILSTTMDILTTDKLAMDISAPPTFRCGSSCVSMSAGSPLIPAHVQSSLSQNPTMRGNGSASSGRWNVRNAALVMAPHQASCDVSNPGLHRSSQTSAAASKQSTSLPINHTTFDSASHLGLHSQYPTLLPEVSSKACHDQPKKQSKPGASSSKACSLLELLSKPAHHPEQYAGELDAMTGVLPEKGKLLEAVMQAGPLLQNLLLAGPLPQWRYPPPQLSSMDIPSIPAVPIGKQPLQYGSVDSNGPFVMQSLTMGYNVPCAPVKLSSHMGFLGAPTYFKSRHL